MEALSKGRNEWVNGASLCLDFYDPLQYSVLRAAKPQCISSASPGTVLARADTSSALTAMLLVSGSLGAASRKKARRSACERSPRSPEQNLSTSALTVLNVVSSVRTQHCFLPSWGSHSGGRTSDCHQSSAEP